MLTLYKNIKKLREELGMSQDELAEKTGYTIVSMKMENLKHQR